MATPITIAGNLTGDPELRFTAGGDPVANLTVAVNERVKRGDQWEDDGATFYRVSVWREQAEHVAESLQKGHHVIATGKLRTRTYEDKNGVERLSLDLTADEIGPSLRYATARVTKAERQGAGWQRDQQPRGGDDPWAQPQSDRAPF